MKKRADLLAGIRRWCAAQNILEIETPLLSAAGNTDFHIESFQLPAGNETRYLRTSAEFHLKRMLAAGSGDCYDLGKVFRYGEQGRYHNPEFTMLEWYRLGMDQHSLIKDIGSLLAALHGGSYPGMVKRSYRAVICEVLQIDPAHANNATLRDTLQNAGQTVPEAIYEVRDALLDLAMGTVVAESLATDQYTCIYDYPASQASLARIDTSDSAWPVASRFEIYYGALELANGFHELDDAQEQRRRFEADQQLRRQHQSMPVTMDESLLAALQAGLPDCAGVAVGVDRLLMVLHPQLERIQQGMSFGWSRA